MGEPLIVWVCKKCGKVESTPEGQTPSEKSPCVKEWVLHDWDPVAHQVIVATPKGAQT